MKAYITGVVFNQKTISATLIMLVLQKIFVQLYQKLIINSLASTVILWTSVVQNAHNTCKIVRILGMVTNTVKKNKRGSFLNHFYTCSFWILGTNRIYKHWNVITLLNITPPNNASILSKRNVLYGITDKLDKYRLQNCKSHLLFLIFVNVTSCHVLLYRISHSCINIVASQWHLPGGLFASIKSQTTLLLK